MLGEEVRAREGGVQREEEMAGGKFPTRKDEAYKGRMRVQRGHSNFKGD